MLNVQTVQQVLWNHIQDSHFCWLSLRSTPLVVGMKYSRFWFSVRDIWFPHDCWCQTVLSTVGLVQVLLLKSPVPGRYVDSIQCEPCNTRAPYLNTARFMTASICNTKEGLHTTQLRYHAVYPESNMKWTMVIQWRRSHKSELCK